MAGKAILGEHIRLYTFVLLKIMVAITFEINDISNEIYNFLYKFLNFSVCDVISCDMI